MKFEAAIYYFLSAFNGYCLLYGAPDGVTNYSKDTFAILMAVFLVGAVIISKLTKRG